MQSEQNTDSAFIRLKQHKGFERLNDEEVQQLLQALQALCQIAVHAYLLQNTTDNSEKDKYAQAS